MRKITHYVLVDSERVQKLILEGWQPWGSPVPVGGNWVSQVMVMYEEELGKAVGPK